MLHPTQKPVEVIEKLITDSTQEGDLVLDCFMGSGTTAVASKNLTGILSVSKFKKVYHYI